MNMRSHCAGPRACSISRSLQRSSRGIIRSRTGPSRPLRDHAPAIMVVAGSLKIQREYSKLHLAT
jgi:hypothetical protein